MARHELRERGLVPSKRNAPISARFDYFLDFFIFFFGTTLVGVSTAVPVAVVPGWFTPTPVDPGCGAEGFAPDCPNAVDIEKPIKAAAKTSFFIVYLQKGFHPRYKSFSELRFLS
jgi:hypothetical protein